MYTHTSLRFHADIKIVTKQEGYTAKKNSENGTIIWSGEHTDPIFLKNGSIRRRTKFKSAPIKHIEV